MEPIAILLTALVNGAAQGIQKSANKSVSDAYQCLRNYIVEKFNKVPIEQIENENGIRSFIVRTIKTCP